jgi:hypothetical protein
MKLFAQLAIAALIAAPVVANAQGEKKDAAPAAPAAAAAPAEAAPAAGADHMAAGDAKMADGKMDKKKHKKHHDKKGEKHEEKTEEGGKM